MNSARSVALAPSVSMKPVYRPSESPLLINSPMLTQALSDMIKQKNPMTRAHEAMGEMMPAHTKYLKSKYM